MKELLSAELPEIDLQGYEAADDAKTLYFTLDGEEVSGNGI